MTTSHDCSQNSIYFRFTYKTDQLHGFLKGFLRCELEGDLPMWGPLDWMMKTDKKKNNVRIFVWKFHCYLRKKIFWNTHTHTHNHGKNTTKGQWYKLRRRKKNITLLAQEKGPNFVGWEDSPSNVVLRKPEACCFQQDPRGVVCCRHFPPRGQ